MPPSVHLEDLRTPAQAEAPVVVSELTLTETDQEWLASYGVAPAWLDNDDFRQELNNLIAEGSRRLDEPKNQIDYSSIIDARLKFMDFIELPEETLTNFRSDHPTVIPLDTFIGTQRTLAELGLDASMIITSFTASLSYSSEAVKAKFDNLTELGLDAAKIMKGYPTSLSYAPESVKEKFDNLTELGLDAAKIMNAFPASLSYAPESVKEKFDNLTELGLDAAKIMNARPVAVGYAPESVRKKFKLLDRSAKLLRWQFSAIELVQTFPTILSLNTQKLAILRRIAATHIHEQARDTSIKETRSALLIPLEKYIIALSKHEDSYVSLSVSGLYKEARINDLAAKERKTLALEVAPGLGRIGVMYLKYRKVKNNI